MKQLLSWLGYFDTSLSMLELRRQRAFVLTAIFMALVVFVDIFQNYQNGYLLHTYEEIVMVPLVLTAYFFQRFKIIRLTTASKMMTVLITFQMLFSFSTPGVGEEIMLFWIATLPLILVLLIDLKDAVRANTGIVIFLILTTVLSKLGWIEALFAFEVLLQVVIGYSLFTILVYMLEKSRTEYEQQLTYRMREREVLLKEVHHRVKNNMQLIISLLGLQAASVDDPKYAKLLLDNVDRIAAMSLVHESIYKAESFDKIDMKSYLEDIVKHLQRITRHKIDYDFAALTLDMKSAMNLGLIMNEAVTNALEHAYPDTEEGAISLSLYENDKMVTMKIKDHGLGLSGTDKEREGLGWTLMNDLSNALKNGKMDFDSANGLELTVYCEVDTGDT